MPKPQICPKCGGQELRRTHRQGAWERFLSVWGYYPYSCKSCRHRFLRYNAGLSFTILVVAAWLVSAAVLGGAVWRLLWDTAAKAEPEPPPKAATVPAAPNGHAARLAQLTYQNRVLLGELKQLRKTLEGVSGEKASLQKQLREARQELVRLRRPRPSAPPVPPPPAPKVLVGAIPFAPGRTKLGSRAKALLKQAALNLGRWPERAVLVEGNADATPLGPETARRYYDNAGVALARALAVFRALRDAGVDPARMTVRAAGAPAKGPEAGRTVNIWLVRKKGGV
jgi:outer membrane protein OmpA-like peptidoglycan-associated protein